MKPNEFTTPTMKAGALELFELCRALNKISILAHRRTEVTRDYDGTEERCVDCSCEVTAGDLTCERCAEIRQLTERALSGGDQ